MAIVKIVDLPLKNTVDNTDIMMIEDKNDTKKITITQLKSVFSADNKINALKQELDKKITDISNTSDLRYKELSQKDIELNNRINTISNDNNIIKRRLDISESDIRKIKNDIDILQSDVVLIKNNIIDIKNNINVIENRIDANDSLISENFIQIESLKDRVSELELNNQNMRNEIDNINSTLESINNTQDKDRNDALELVKKLEDKILKYIDYYHHIHENPPSFQDITDSGIMNMAFNGDNPNNYNNMIIGEKLETKIDTDVVQKDTFISGNLDVNKDNPSEDSTFYAKLPKV